jgi:hypothetical protein
MSDKERERTRGLLRYSMPTLLALRLELSKSLIRLYLSTRKLSVGPPGKRTIRRDGETGVNVKAKR